MSFSLKLRYFIAALFVFLVALGWYMIPGFHIDRLNTTANTKNAVWIEHSFAEEFKNEEDIKELFSNLQAHNIQFVYLHVGPLEQDGSIPSYKYQASRRLLDMADIYAPFIIFEAWIGQIRSQIPLEKSDVRNNIAKTAALFTQEVGFDGIHFDIEPIEDDDPFFLDLLQKTRSVIGENRRLSVASDEWQPKNLTRLIAKIIDKEIRSYWGTRYLKNVGDIVDNIVIMTYDSDLSKDWMYSYWVEQQVIYATKALKNARAKVLIGIPVYDEPTESFNPEVENIQTGLKGVRDGISNIRSRVDRFEGVALYPYWMIDESEWEIYDSLWVNKKTQ